MSAVWRPVSGFPHLQTTPNPHSHWASLRGAPVTVHEVEVDGGAVQRVKQRAAEAGALAFPSGDGWGRHGQQGTGRGGPFIGVNPPTSIPTGGAALIPFQLPQSCQWNGDVFALAVVVVGDTRQNALEHWGCIQNLVEGGSAPVLFAAVPPDG